MRRTAFAALVLVTAMLVLPPALGLHHVGDADSGSFTHVQKTFFTPIGTAVWWDYSTVAGVSTGIQQFNGVFELINTAPAVITAETFPISTPDTTKTCLPTSVPEVQGQPVLVVHEIDCVKMNGYTVQLHYFPWSNDPNDPDHVVSPTAATPTAPLVWRVDLETLSYKTAVVPPGHWQVWVHPAIAPPGLGYNIKYTVDSRSSFYYDFLGHRGCPFYADIAAGISDQALLGCPNDYEA